MLRRRRQRPGENACKDREGEQRDEKRAGRARRGEEAEGCARVLKMGKVEETPDHGDRLVERDLRDDDRLRGLIEDDDAQREGEVGEAPRHRGILTADDRAAACADPVFTRLDVLPDLPAARALGAFGGAREHGVGVSLPRDRWRPEHVSQSFF